MTLVDIETNITLAKAAYQKAFAASNYSIASGGSSRSITRQKLLDLKNEWKYWEQEKIKYQNGTKGIPVKQIVQIDE